MQQAAIRDYHLQLKFGKSKLRMKFDAEENVIF